MKIGANCLENGMCEFKVWAPAAESVVLKLVSPSEKTISMQKDDRGYWKTLAEDVSPGASYLYVIDGEKERPDPASFFQPEGVHSPSHVLDHSAFKWEDEKWKGIAMRDMIMYELHIGTFTAEGTFDAVIPQLDGLKDTGINAVEIMPVAQFPGERNWGYDGVYPFTVQNSYGGPDGLKRLVNECHRRGMAVILDVVYNHLGPEGNYTRDYGPYFTDRYKTPWGDAVNFDGPYSNGVRNFFVENALYWFEHYHIDALRLDAIHGIYDMSARHFLHELAERTAEFSVQHGRKFYLIAESDLNDPRVAETPEREGHGIDGLWCDDFHHAVHTLLTGEDEGYYADFGKMDHLVKALRDGFVYSGQYSAFRKKNHGESSAGLPADRFIVFSQNHDQTGNRTKGERLASLVSFEAQKLAAGIVMLSPYIPLIFMGEEYGETAPFLYFISHSDTHLIERVREGRKKEFESFGWEEEPPDPQSVKTFAKSRLNREKASAGSHKVMKDFYRELIGLRKNTPALSSPERDKLEAWSAGGILFLKRWKDGNHVLVLFNFNKKDIIIGHGVPDAGWKKVLDSSGKEWNGPGSTLPEVSCADAEMTLRAESFVLYAKDC